MNFDIDLKKLPDLLKQLQGTVSRYAPVALTVLVLFVYSALIWQINSLSSAEPSDDQIADQLKATQRIKINANTIEKIERLQDQNIKVKTLFEDARKNPFEE